MKYFYSLICAVLLLPVVCSSQNILVTGRMTTGGGEGINIFNFNPSDAGLTLISKAETGPNPSFLCFSEKGNLIYAANEVNRLNGKRGGGVSTLEYNKDFSKVTKVNEISVPNGAPCYVSVSPDNDFLFTANYTGSSVAVFRLGKNGIPESICDSIKFPPREKKVSHPHMISFDPAGKRIYLTDLGFDRIMIYTIDKATGKLKSLYENGIPLPEGTGPRHFVFNRNGTKMYVIGELKSTVTVFDVKEKEGLILLQTISTLAESYKGSNASADLHMDKSGKFLYGSNRGENSIVTFSIGKDGLLTLAGSTGCGGEVPRNFTLDPAGKYLLVGNQRTGNIAVLGIDPKTGVPSEKKVEVPLPGAVCLKFFIK
jgi:6-phosphogluconolactonase